MSNKLWNPDKTIFVQISNFSLKTRIEAWAVCHDLDVFIGSGSDLIACGYLFAIVDRREVDRKVWSDFLDYLRESEVLTPCVVLHGNRSEVEKGLLSLLFVHETVLSDLKGLLDDLLQKCLNS